MRLRKSPDAELYQLKQQQLRLLEQQAPIQGFDLYYGDATTISERGYVPYAWQFEGENIGVAAAHRGRKINVFGIYNRHNQFHYWIDTDTINTNKIVSMLDEFSWRICRPTVLVLDNAPPHRAKKVQQLIPYWQQRGLYLFFLPPYSPHLNLIERLWKEMKARYLIVEDYQSADHLFYALNRVCANVGLTLKLNFK